MRVVINLISYAIAPVGVALSLWAASQWDMPVPLALTVVSLAWAYCLFLVLLTITTGSRYKKTDDVSVVRGIVDSVDRSSQDSIEIGLLVDNVRRRFTALQGMVGKLARGDSVILACIWQSREILRIATIDTSTAGRIILESGGVRSEKRESTIKFAGCLLCKKDLHNQAIFATLVPGGIGAISAAVLVWSEWAWGWAFLVLALGLIWLILTMVVGTFEHNYKSLAEIKLDMGYVQEVKEGRDYISEGSSSFVVSQSIVIADSAPPNGLNKRIYGTFDEILPIQEGDLVLLSIDHNGGISNFRIEPTEEARKPRLLLQHEVAEDACAVLHNIGIDASVPQDQFTEETWIGWVQIAEGPIRWIGQYQEWGRPYHLYVPDSRIGPKFPEVVIFSESYMKVEAQTLKESLRLAAGPALSPRQEEVRWVLSKYESDTNEGFSLGIAEQLTNCRILTENTNQLLIRSNPDRGCWILMSLPLADIRNEPVTKPFWDFCQKVAEALLAMPMPTSGAGQR